MYSKFVFGFLAIVSEVYAHGPLSFDQARAKVKRNEHANYKCKKALEARNNLVYNNILQKRDAYDFVFDNDTSYTPQGFNTSVCSLSEETVVGPYFVLGDTKRENITEGQPGFPLYLDVLVMNTETCEPLIGAIVDFWHANATGVYSHFVESSVEAAGGGSNNTGMTSASGMPSGSMPSGTTSGPAASGSMGAMPSGGGGGSGSGTYGSTTPEDSSTFLRGWQYTDANGVVKIETIYPGWYEGRALHIHLQVFMPGTVFANGTYATNVVRLHTGQIFFNETLTKDMANYEPYSRNTNTLTLNSNDSIYLDEGGEYSLLNLVQLGADYSTGFLGSLTVGVDSNSTDTSSSTTTSGVTATTATAKSTGSTTATAVTTASPSSGSHTDGLMGQWGRFFSIPIALFVGFLLF